MKIESMASRRDITISRTDAMFFEFHFMVSCPRLEALRNNNGLLRLPSVWKCVEHEHKRHLDDAA